MLGRPDPSSAHPTQTGSQSDLPGPRPAGWWHDTGMESWRPDRFCRGPGLGGEGRQPGREVLDADGRLWGTVKWREIEQSWAHGAEGLSGHRWASGCSLCVFPSTELGSPPSHPITTGSVGPEDACQLLQRALSASHLPPTPRPLPPEISKNWKIRSRREVWGKPSLQDDCDVCRNTRVFTEWVLSGWFSLFCSGQNTGNGLRLQLRAGLEESLGSRKPLFQVQRGLQRLFCSCAENVKHSQYPEGSGLAAQIHPLPIHRTQMLRAVLSQVSVHSVRGHLHQESRPSLCGPAYHAWGTNRCFFPLYVWNYAWHSVKTHRYCRLHKCKRRPVTTCMECLLWARSWACTPKFSSPKKPMS
uniref:uncharacterized protein LOC118520090 n=1 Tax=Halichoerus grypus TaxID=9711 RepID=UPI0016594EE8|nr:uncharacterized protein LOC118520090 [Halichoerus grypus]